MSCRLPGGIDSPESLWKFLLEGCDAVTAIPDDRWNHRNLYLEGGANVPGRIVTDQAGLLEDPSLFDAEFFGISAREAQAMDPQQRLLLECSYEALEDAGLPAQKLQGSPVGVFVGATLRDYAKLQSFENADGTSVSGGAMSLLANRISFYFDFQGPSWSIDTACSSSLSALHSACQSLRNRECDVVLVGCVNLILSTEEFVAFSNAGMLSPDGRCRAFDRDGLGYVRSEGAVVMIVKRLADCQNERVHAQILNTGANQDGRSSALTIPSEAAQADLLRKVYGDIGLKPEQVSYIEAHGTGTPVGDPIEANAIGSVLGRGRDKDLLLGSIKTNLGHLEGASGLAGLLKAVLIARHGVVPASLHFNNPHPDIDFEGQRLKVPTTPTPISLPAAIGINSFGLGGANAHAIIASAPKAPMPSVSVSGGPWLLPISAGSRSAYSRRIEQFGALLDQNVAPQSLCHQASARSGHQTYRSASVIDSGRINHLSAACSVVGTPEKLSYLFCGQGAIWWRTGRELFAAEPAFRRCIEECDQILARWGDLSLARELSLPEDANRLGDTSVSQPLLFAVQMGIVRVLQSWGITPDTVLGHSAGIPAALCTAGAISLQDGVRIAYHRGQLMDIHAPRGRMLAVQLSEAELADSIGKLPGVVVAAYNGPTSTVLSGPPEQLDPYALTLTEQGIFNRPLNVDLCFHHPGLAPIVEPLLAALADVHYSAPTVPVMCSVLVRPLEVCDLTPDFWCSTVLEPVRFLQATRELVKEGETLFLEIGPHPVLSNGVRDILDEDGAVGQVLSTLVRGRPERETLLESAGRLYEAGHPLAWETINPPAPFVELPPYPWTRESYWSESRTSQWERFGPTRHPLLGRRTRDQKPTWVQQLDTRTIPFLLEHRLSSNVVLSATTYLAICAAAGQAVYATDGLRIEDLTFHEMLMISDENHVELKTTLDESHRIEISSNVSGAPDRWTLHASARVLARSGHAPDRLRTAEILERCRFQFNSSEFELFRPNRFQRSGSFDCLQSLHTDHKEALVFARGDNDASFVLHPGWVDNCLYAAGALGAGGTYVPTRMGRVSIYRAHSGDVVAHVRTVSISPRNMRFDFDFATADGEIFAQIEAYAARQMSVAEDEPEHGWVYPGWEELEDEGAAPLSTHGGGELEGGGAAPLSTKYWLVLGATPQEPFVAAARCQGIQVTEASNAELAALPSTKFTQIVQFVAPEGETLDLLTPLLTVASQLEGRQLAWAVVTRMSQCVTAEEREVQLSTSPVWGMMRSIASELSLISVRLLDVDGVDERLIRELISNSEETEVALRADRRYVGRLFAGDLATVQKQSWVNSRPDQDSYYLAADPGGRLDEICLRRFQVNSPQPDEVVIEVEAAAVNFVDLMKCLNSLPGEGGDSMSLGGEAAGVVTQVGTNVTSLRVGQRVLAHAGSAMASDVTVRADYVLALKEEQGYAEMAGMPIVFMTAIYALEDKAQLQTGEKILIHSAAGGLGLAAIQVARHLGAEIYATAGTEEKREWLRSQGIEHVFDSRNLHWVAQVREASGGVDVVLNALSGEHIDGGLEVLRAFGRFVEVGKRDLWEGGGLSLSRFRRNQTYFCVDLDAVSSGRPALLVALMAKLKVGIDEGYFSPLPFQVFSLANAFEAFHKMTRGEHIGKMILRRPQSSVRLYARKLLGPICRASSSYLIVGTRGAAVMAAHWLVRQGARHLIFISRNGKLQPAEAERLRSLGAEIREAAVDVANSVELKGLLDSIPSDLPLRGIIQSAMVLDDGLATQQTPQRLEQVLRPKVQGSWNLHQLTLTSDLDFFVMFSSIASLLGSPGQSSYAAANAYQDALALYRRRHGLVGLSLNLAALRGFGYLSRNADLADYLEKGGIQSLGPLAFEGALEAALRSGVIQVGTMRLSKEQVRHLRLTPRLSPLWEAAAQHAVQQQTPLEVLRAAPAGERTQIMSQLLVAQVARILRVETERVDVRRRLLDLGMDSLMALELRNWLMESFGVNFSGSDALRLPNFIELAQSVVEKLSFNHEVVSHEKALPEASIPEIDDLSDEEVEAMLGQMLSLQK